jgi:hypothetical protein
MEQFNFTIFQGGVNKMTRATGETAKKLTTGKFRRRIGHTTYRVGVYFNNASHETFDDKIVRLVRNESVGREAVKK